MAVVTCVVQGKPFVEVLDGGMSICTRSEEEVEGKEFGGGRGREREVGDEKRKRWGKKR